MCNQQKLVKIAMLGAGLLFGVNAWSGEAGRVQFVNGEVLVTDIAGRVHAMQKGEVINEGDTITSAKTSSAQIKMMDGGFIAVRPETRLKFEQFKFSGKEDGEERGFFSLLKGGFRAVTGLIGHLNKQNYKVTTPAATIGIRGTDHETFVITPDSPLAKVAPVGAYNKVNTGETSLTTDRGTINIQPNQMGFAGGMNQLPQIQPVNTNLFTVAPPPSLGARTGNGNGGETTERATAVVDNTAQPATGAGTTTTTAAADSNTAIPQTVVPPAVVVNPVQVVVPTLPAQAAGGIGLFYRDANGNVFSAGGGGTAQLTANQTGGMSGFTANLTQGVCITNCVGNGLGGGASFQSGTLGGASLVDQGSNLLAGNLHWGRWIGQGATIVGLPTGSAIYNSNLTYIGGDIPTMPVTGTATYVPIGGTAPVDAAGNTGKFLGANITVAFASLGLTVSNMQVAFGANATYTMNGSSTFLSNGTIPAAPFSSVTCAGTTCNTIGLKGDYAGAFTGTNAAGIGLVYHVVAGTVSPGMPPSFEIMGSQGFLKQ